MFHNKHHLKLWDKSHYTDLFGGLENCFTQDVDRYGWLLNFINLVCIRYSKFVKCKSNGDN